MTRGLAILLAATFLLPSLSLSQTTTATKPTTLPIDLSTAQSAAKSYFLALNMMHIDAALQAVVDTPVCKEVVHLDIDSRKAAQSLRQAIVETIPKSEWSPGIRAALSMKLSTFDIDQVKEIKKEDQVLFYGPEINTEPLIVTKVGDKWLVDSEHCLVAGSKAVSLGIYREEMVGLRDIYQKLADELREKKFKDTKEFKIETGQRLKELREKVEKLKLDEAAKGNNFQETPRK